MFPRSIPRFAALLITSLGLVACKPTSSTPPPPGPPAPAPEASATKQTAHEHAHGEPPKRTGKGKRDVVRVGVESLDVAVDGSTIHLLLGDYHAETKLPALQHLRSTDGGATWSAPVRVDAGATPPKSPHRGMDAQLAASGTKLIALWGTAGTGLFGSGPIATARSADGGATWQPGPNPADDGLTTGHGFVDIAADSAGTFHLVWLDSRDGKQGLRYAQSKDGGKSWSKNATLKSETCECCWNTLALGADGSVHALFRDKNPRDMAVISSPDHGARWSDPAKVGRFNWDFTGCPHVGGGLLVRGSTLHALVWTGATSHNGAYHLASPDQGQSWSAPQRLGDADARRGDLATASSQSLAAVWDRVSDGESTVLASTSANGGQTWTEPKQLSTKGVNAAYPRVVAVSGSYRVFWTESATGQPGTWKSAALGN
jgi:hypothetical protein